jgi:DNA-binding IclR family transcriptional regulator
MVQFRTQSESKILRYLEMYSFSSIARLEGDLDMPLSMILLSLYPLVAAGMVSMDGNSKFSLSYLGREYLEYHDEN